MGFTEGNLCQKYTFHCYSKIGRISENSCAIEIVIKVSVPQG